MLASVYLRETLARAQGRQQQSLRGDLEMLRKGHILYIIVLANVAGATTPSRVNARHLSGVRFASKLFEPSALRKLYLKAKVSCASQGDYS